MDEGVQAAGAMLYVLSESVKLATDLLVATVKTTGSTGKQSQQCWLPTGRTARRKKWVRSH